MINVLRKLDELKSIYTSVDLGNIKNKVKRKVEAVGLTDEKDIYREATLFSQDNVSLEEPEWTYIASKLYLESMYLEAKENRGSLDFYNLIEMLIKESVYDDSILTYYSKEEIDDLGNSLVFERDNLLTYIGLRTLDDRYLASKKNKDRMELPQERWMVIAMTLMQEEDKSKRLELVKEAYWALSNLYMTVATPTMANAGKVNGQLSSCFIDTIDDDLKSIYDVNTDVAQVSKNGGGVGVYIGKVRASGGSIRGHKNTSSGVIPWIKQLNNTAVSVDQLGTRKGAIAIYLDVWHKDIMSFLDVKLNNGDSRMRAHDIFPGVCIPNLFMEKVEERGEWHLFDPHEVKQVMGFALEDFYDEKVDDGTFRKKYQECVDNPNLSRKTVKAIDIMKRVMISQLETGTPFMFYRDTANQMNANSHEGIIYCSNLCTEITQNQSPSKFIEEYVENENVLVKKYEVGDFVVCNLSSVNLGRAVKDDILDRLINIQVRMLDNVIDVNTLPVKQAELTNQRYRAIGLGTFGLHHLLVQKGIDWESEEAVKFSDELYEKIAFLTIKASSDIAKEKGSYKLFEGSDWDTGDYFTKKGYLDGNSSLDWEGLANTVKENGIRNGYLMAVAPNSTTSIIAGSTASIDPVFRLQYSEEKKDYRIPVTAPGYTEDNKDIYKTAYELDQLWSIKQNGARQKHIDQSISFNIYVRNDIKAAELLNFHIQAWKEGLKATYYIRSTSGSEE